MGEVMKIFFWILVLFIFFPISENSLISKSITTNDSKIDFFTLIGAHENDDAYNIIQDSDGNFFIAGSTESSNFPIKNGFNSTNPTPLKRIGYVAKISPQGELLAST